MVARINFDLIASRALQQSESLVADWLPDGTRAGPEWKALNPLRADGKPGSFSVNLTTGKWGDFATGDVGLDLVSLYAYLFHGGDNGLAARELADRLGCPEAITEGGSTARRSAAKGETAKPSTAKPAKPKAEKAKPAVWTPITPVPSDAPVPPKAHEFRGVPERVWTYRDAGGAVLGYVCRFRTSDGGKEVLPLTFCVAEVTGKRDWRWQQWTEPRPMYGLDRLAGQPDAPVVLVEGEKCADAPVELLPATVWASWPGGGKAVDKVDWSPLAGRDVVLWPDCDAQREKLTKDEKDAGIDAASKPLLPAAKQPGIAAMEKIAAHLLALQPPARVRLVEVPEPGEVPGGWDVDDVVEMARIDGDAADVPNVVRRWLRNQRPSAAEAATMTPAQMAPTDQKAAADEASGGDDSDVEPSMPRWKRGLIWKQFPWDLEDCRENVFLFLTRCPDWRGVLGYDEFTCAVVKLKPTPCGREAGEWTSEDDLELGLWLAQQHKFLVRAEGTLTAGVQMAALRNKFHPIRQYLRALPAWDGDDRLGRWLFECMGAQAQSAEYLPLVGRLFVLGMIHRVMRPGCKWDYMPVFEGAQGRGKSTALRVLADPWFSDTQLHLGDKDAYMQLDGAWLYEIGEMDSFNRAEATAVKAFVTSQADKYRPPYGRRMVVRPRQTAFGGTTNQGEYFKDSTGARRFWPVRCRGVIDTEKLKAWRDQMFAQALALYDAGHEPRPGRDEEARVIRPEQEARQIVDPWLVKLQTWLDDPERTLKHEDEFTSFDLLTRAIGMDCNRIDGTRSAATRIGMLMQQLGWPKRRRSGGLREWVYCRPRPPEKPANGDAQAKPDDGAPGAGGSFKPGF